MDYVIHLLILICIYLILAQSLNLTFGLGGLLNLAHIGSYAIGAYVTALLSTEFQRSIYLCLPASMVVAAFFALLIGGIAARLRHDYFALGTLAFSSIVSAVLINWKSVTRGVLGIPGIPRPEIGEIDFYQNYNFLKLVALLTFVSLAVLLFLFRSRFARNLRAQAENPYATMALGKSIRSIRNDAFIISSMFAGLAGGIFAYYINYIDPSSFALHEMVFVLSVVIVGKPGSFWGIVASTVFLVLLPEPLRFIEMSPNVIGPLRQMLYALILFFVLYWKRETLFPVERSI